MSTADHTDEAREDLGTLLGADIRVTGDIQAAEDLHVDGHVKGDIRCSTLVLGQTGSVTGGIYADRVWVAGSVNGSMETNELAIESGAKVKGKIAYSRIRISPGGTIEGKITVRTPGDDEDPSQPKVVKMPRNGADPE
jgi:cytoskeletal protein CcmA (bactofilin family)